MSILAIVTIKIAVVNCFHNPYTVTSLRVSSIDSLSAQYLNVDFLGLSLQALLPQLAPCVPYVLSRSLIPSIFALDPLLYLCNIVLFILGL